MNLDQWILEAENQYKAASDTEDDGEASYPRFAAQTAATIALAKAIAAQPHPAPVAEKRPSARDAHEALPEAVEYWQRKHDEARDLVQMLYQEWPCGVEMPCYDEVMALLEPQAEQAADEPAVNWQHHATHWQREHGRAMDLLRDVLGDLPEGFTSPAVKAARDEVTPF